MFDHNAYRERCSELHVSEEALQEVIEMAEQKQKKPVRRPLRVGLIAAVFYILGHYLGAGLAIKNGSRIVRPTVILVLILLLVKVVSELLFPEFWS